jgi:O-antigen ligase
VSAPLTLPRSFASDAPARLYALPVSVLAGAVGALAVVSPPLALVAVIALIFVVTAFHDLALGVVLFVPLTFVQGLSPAVRPALGAAGIVLVLAALRQRGRPLLPRDRPTLAYSLIVLVAWGASSTLWAEDLDAAAFPALQLALVVALMFVVFSAIRETRHVRWIVWSYIAGAAISSGAGFFTPTQLGRFTGGVGDSNFLAALVASALALALFAYPVTRTPFARWLLLSCAFLFVTTLFLTGSRGGLVALAAFVISALSFGGALRPHVFAMTLVVVAIGLGYYAFVASPDTLERVRHPAGGSGRTDIWSIALRAGEDHPFTGVGIGNFPAVKASYAAGTIDVEAVRQVVDEPIVVHNTYLELFVELGVAGLIAFATVVLASLTVAVRVVGEVVGTGDREVELLGRGVVVAIVTLLAAFAFLSAEYEKQLWLLLGVAAALSSVARFRGLVPYGPRQRQV